MPMQIINCGRGVHRREVKGVERLRDLPDAWYAFTNLDLAMGIGRSREIDVIVVADDRIFVIDLKDWNGRVESAEGKWTQNGRKPEPSPVYKINQNAKDVLILLEPELKRHAKGAPPPTPRIQGLVVMTGNADISGISPTEVSSVLHVDRFIRMVSTPQERVKWFGGVNPAIVATPLTSPEWKQRLSSFFNAKTGKIKPGRRRYGNYVAHSDDATFQHEDGLFFEYDAEDENAPRLLGTLRTWDFSKAEDRFRTEEGRNEILGREQAVTAYLADRSDAMEAALLGQKAYDPDRGIDHWEVFDRRQRLRRLSDFVGSEAPHLSRDTRTELARQILARVASLHVVDTAHLDLGAHSIWLEAPSTVRLSHLLAAQYPQIASLGEDRLRFLSSLKVPEDILGGGGDHRRKDVFLAAAAVHHLLLGSPPTPAKEGEEVAEWSVAADRDLTFAELHPWFEQALALEPSRRFADAGAALRAFNEATAVRPSAKDVAEGLETFRRTVRTQKQLFATFPEEQVVTESDRVDAWVSHPEEGGRFVKLWKRAAWGDQEREAPRILDFLQRAQDLALDPPAHCARIQEAYWLYDSFALVQELVAGSNLAASLFQEPDRWRPKIAALGFTKALAEAVRSLHERGLAHGDLKPHNVMVAGTREGPEPIMVDLLDFSAAADGEIRSGAYAPPAGGRPERDRYAVGRIAGELLAACDVTAEEAEKVEQAIAFCRDQSPGNATLDPLVAAIDAVLAPPAHTATIRMIVSVRDAGTGNLEPDEGRLFVRRAKEGQSFHIRGASEELRVWLDPGGSPTHARRRSLDQGQIKRTSSYEFMSIEADLSIARGDLNDLSGLAPLLHHSEFVAGWASSDPMVGDDAAGVDDGSEVDAGEATAPEAGDTAEDRLAEEASDQAAPERIDVSELWRALVDVEGELTTEGVAHGPSQWRNDVRRHVVPFELSRGTFDFNKADTVGVERLDNKGLWRRVGELDIARSKPDRILVEADEGGQRHRSLVRENDRLRFTSHFGLQSLRRRESATNRILARESRIRPLVDLFDARQQFEPEDKALDPGDLTGYGLNPAQVEALRTVLLKRPLGLVQGPPGTGKTKFIAALAHHAMTTGLARNVLLASQSHEAVNNAAESVLRLFTDADAQPSLLRVGNEAVVSERLLPFHTEKVERRFKDRFGAEGRERLRIAGRSMGLPEDLTNAVWLTETAVRPVASAYVAHRADAAPDVARVDALRRTLEVQLGRVGVRADEVDDASDAAALVDSAFARLAARRWAGERIASDRIARLRTVAAIGRDFINSVSTAQRGFETFLAGTRQIVAGTCVGLGRPSLGLVSTPFDLVIVDEAARCTASELSVPMQAGRWIVLVGDQAQLEPQLDPIVVERVARSTGNSTGVVMRSDFARAFSTTYGQAVGRRLVTQYRMLEPIGRMVSATFYDGKLEHGRTEPEIDPSCLPPDLAAPLTWVTTDGLGEIAFQQRETSGTSLSNPEEANAIMALLEAWSRHDPFVEWIMGQRKHSHVIGIICMYAAQRDMIRRRISGAALPDAFRRSLKIDTVDSYQGKENPIVLLSLVRNNANGPTAAGSPTISAGFLSRPNRINVAASRAMDRLVIVGARNGWAAGSPLARLESNFSDEEDAGHAAAVAASDLTAHGKDGAHRQRQVGEPVT